MKRIYLDANGSHPAVMEAKQKLMNAMEWIGNPSSPHQHGRIMRASLDEARHYVTQAVGAFDKEVIFTSGASEANRLFVDTLARTANKPLKVLMSPFEHPSLVKPILKAADAGFFAVEIMELNNDGSLNINGDFIKQADVIVVTIAHNETGILPDLGSVLAHARADTLVMSDISQGLARLDVPPSRIDVMTFSAQKMGGFAGVGGLVLRGVAKTLQPPWAGSGQERGFRPGTECSQLIFACGAAARVISHTRRAHYDLRSLRDHLEYSLKQRAPIMVIGESQPRLTNTSAICFLHQDPDALRIGCDLAGLSVGFGAACAGLAPEGSFALKQLGLSLLQERSTVRFSLSPHNTKDEIDEVVTRLCEQVLVKSM